ncbi:helix-turn-helix transcriptional regulator [Luteimonas sp. SJ-92]|uniref:Helix-turn-helix transcriptional regulator n=1 Tax=Luteimonas salinisoli TaxID=2752307 RepID=A0A853JGW6_9GAMM|nr:AraC family transcriptional regulator [Luteimonas salinisoli]NZA27962.1 helix-turn-helix transcriptional regulator [Luteimonas salinisoli]
MTPNVETARSAEQIGAPVDYSKDPGEVAVLLNDAKAALRSDREFARTCVARALDLLHEDPAPASRPSACLHGGLAGWQVRHTVAYIEAHLESSIRIKDLAALTRLSASHFSRAFKQSFGQAPMTYVAGQRVQLAQRLLLTTEDSMCQIALACGMCDQAHLTRVFRRLVGDTPMAWRRRHADLARDDQEADRRMADG